MWFAWEKEPEHNDLQDLEADAVTHLQLMRSIN